eukprot:scpid19229/ scgid1768/ E3 ubiquitin-protein ligase RFWD3; RING finger and WD repeat domain-containing protein 3; RING finger protein 201
MATLDSSDIVCPSPPLFADDEDIVLDSPRLLVDHDGPHEALERREIDMQHRPFSSSSVAVSSAAGGAEWNRQPVAMADDVMSSSRTAHTRSATGTQRGSSADGDTAVDSMASTDWSGHDLDAPLSLDSPPLLQDVALPHIALELTENADHSRPNGAQASPISTNMDQSMQARDGGTSTRPISSAASGNSAVTRISAAAAPIASSSIAGDSTSPYFLGSSRTGPVGSLPGSAQLLASVHAATSSQFVSCSSSSSSSISTSASTTTVTSAGGTMPAHSSSSQPATHTHRSREAHVAAPAGASVGNSANSSPGHARAGSRVETHGHAIGLAMGNASSAIASSSTHTIAANSTATSSSSTDSSRRRHNQNIANDHGHLSLHYHTSDRSRISVTLDPTTTVSLSVVQVPADGGSSASEDDDETDRDNDGDETEIEIDEAHPAVHNAIIVSDSDSDTPDQLPTLTALDGADDFRLVDATTTGAAEGEANGALVPPMSDEVSIAIDTPLVSSTAATPVSVEPGGAAGTSTAAASVAQSTSNALADQSLAEFETKRPKKRSRAEMEETADEPAEEGNTCTICFDEWTNAGTHRISALRCGHLYGFSCIDRWVRSNGTCPQCKAKSKRSEIRKLYANKISALDTTERDKAIEDLQAERRERLRVEEIAAQFQLQNKLLQQECQRMKQQLQQQHRDAELAKSSVGSASNTARSTVSSRTTSPTSLLAAGLQTTETRSFMPHKNISVAQSEARVMDFDRSNGILVVSRPSARENQLLRGAGLVKVSLQDSRHMEYVNIHTQRIRDVSVSRDSVALTASEDKSLRLTSMISNTVVQKYSVPTAAWACCWHHEEPQYFFAGLQNSKVLLFDVRNTSQHVAVVGEPTMDGGESTAAAVPVRRGGPPLSGPVVSMCHVAPGPVSGNFRAGGLLVCRTTGLTFYQHDNGADYSVVPMLTGNTYNVSWESGVRHGLVSLRPGKNSNHVQHMLFQLSKSTDSSALHQPTGSMAASAGASFSSAVAAGGGGGAGHPRFNCVMPLTGGVSARLLSKSALFVHPDEQGSLLAAVPDDSAQAVLVFDCQQGTEIQRLTCLSSGQKEILHSRQFKHNGEHFISALTETNLALFRWT